MNIREKKSLPQVGALVTGATGFIGGHLVKDLLREGYSVRVLLRSGHNAQRWRDLGVEVVKGSLEDRDSVLHAASGARVIYNCAGLSSDWAPYEDFYATNVVGVRNLLEAVAKCGVARLVHLSTSDVYGYPKKAGDETRPIKDVGLPYNRSKVQGEREIWQAVEQKSLPVTVFRPASVYGPGSKEWVVEIGRLMLQKQMVLLSGGRSGAGLVYVNNLTRAMITAARTAKAQGQAYNMRDISFETWKDFVDSLGQCFVKGSWKAMNIPAPLAYGLAGTMECVYAALRIKQRPLLTRHAVHLLSRDQCFVVNKARCDLGFESWVSFEEGMARTRAWLASEEGLAALEYPQAKMVLA